MESKTTMFKRKIRTRFEKKNIATGYIKQLFQKKKKHHVWRQDFCILNINEMNLSKYKDLIKVEKSP